MISLGYNKSNIFAPSLFRLSRTISYTLFAATIGFFGVSIAATADVLVDRKAGFKANASSMRAIAAAIGDGDYPTVIKHAKMISSWARDIPSYFPQGSEVGDTKARAEIWFNFEDFTALSKANGTAAKKLIKAAKSGDPGAMMAGLKNLGMSCKACHKSYKD